VVNDAADGQGAVDQTLDEQAPWWEKVANGVGGFGFAVVDCVVLGSTEAFGSAVDAMFGTRLAASVKSGRSVIGEWIDQTWVTNEQWYFGGQAVGDAVSVAGGSVVAVVGVATLVGSVPFGAASTLVTATGIGAPVGAAGLVVSGAGVAAGVAELGVGVAMMVGGVDSFGEDRDQSKAADERNLSEEELDDLDLHDEAHRIAEHCREGNHILDGVAPGTEDDYIYSIVSGQRAPTNYEQISLSGRAVWQDGKN
jgi:hypothetical protein